MKNHRQKLFDYFAQEHGISLMDSDFNELDNYATAVEAEKWKPYPLNQDLVIPERIYTVTLPDLTVHSCFGISFDKLHVIAFCSPTPYQPEGSLSDVDLTPKQRANKAKYFNPKYDH